MVHRFALPILVAALAGASACTEGDGSDIGPKLEPLPGPGYKLQVLDDASRGVVGARIVVDRRTGVTGRNGRADLFVSLAGSQLVTIDAAAASATGPDRLASMAVRAQGVSGGFDGPVWIPDLAPSAGLDLPAGQLAAESILDDAATSGAVLAFAAGTSIGSAVRVRTGVLQGHHLPGAFDAGTLVGRGILVDPQGLTGLAAFPGATFSVPDDCNMPENAQVRLLRYAADAGTWELVTTGTVAAGRATFSDAVRSGGLYVMAAGPFATGSISGRVLNLFDDVVSNAFVRVDSVRAKTDGNGNFRCDSVVAVDGSGSPRQVAVEIVAGNYHLPARLALTAQPVANTTTELGTLELETVFGGNVRMLAVEQGRSRGLLRLTTSGERMPGASVGFADAGGEALLEDVPARVIGTTVGLPVSREEFAETQQQLFVSNGELWRDWNVYFDDLNWYRGGRRTRMQALDALGGGPIRYAYGTRGGTPGGGYVGETQSNGTLSTDRNVVRLTMAVETTSTTGVVTSAVTFDPANAEHLEFPLERAVVPQLGAFDRNGIVSGVLRQASPAASVRHEVRASRRIEPGEWQEAVMRDRPIPSSMPLKLAPEAPLFAFAAGVGAPVGNLAVAEIASATGSDVLQRVGIQPGFPVVEGAILDRDVTLDLVADQPFDAPGALQGLDPAIPSADLAFDLALLLPNNLGCDVARGIEGNKTANADDLQLSLPPLVGGAAGANWLCALRGSAVVADSTIDQRSLLVFDASRTAPVTPFLPAPVITSPLPGDSVPASGFTVQYQPPAGALWVEIELRSTVTGTSGLLDTCMWRVIAPATSTSHTLVELPSRSVTPLLPGRTYALTVTAFRADRGILPTLTDPYYQLTRYFLSLDLFEAGVTAVSRRTIQISTQ